MSSKIQRTSLIMVSPCVQGPGRKMRSQSEQSCERMEAIRSEQGQPLAKPNQAMQGHAAGMIALCEQSLRPTATAHTLPFRIRAQASQEVWDSSTRAKTLSAKSPKRALPVPSDHILSEEAKIPSTQSLMPARINLARQILATTEGGQGGQGQEPTKVNQARPFLEATAEAQSALRQGRKGKVQGMRCQEWIVTTQLCRRIGPKAQVQCGQGLQQKAKSLIFQDSGAAARVRDAQSPLRVAMLQGNQDPLKAKASLDAQSPMQATPAPTEHNLLEARASPSGRGQEQTA